MRSHRVTAVAMLIALPMLYWAADPSRQDSFVQFVFFLGPSLVFSSAVATYALLRGRRAGLWAFLFGPALYYGAMWLFAAGDDWAALFLLSGVVAALAFLALTRCLVFPTAPWSDVYVPGAASVLAAFPLLLWRVESPFGLPIGHFWFWGVHVTVWWAAVAYGVDRMAERSRRNAGAAGVQHAD